MDFVESLIYPESQICFCFFPLSEWHWKPETSQLVHKPWKHEVFFGGNIFVTSLLKRSVSI